VTSLYNIVIIDGENDSVIDTFAIGNNPERIAANPKSNHIYVSVGIGGKVWVLEDKTVGIHPASGKIPPHLELSIKPKPLRNQTVIGFYLAGDRDEKTDAAIKVYNIRGSLLKTFNLNSLHNGYHTIVWNNDNVHGKKVGSGYYLVRLETMNNRIVKRFVLCN
jgi:hypothetical protein